MLIALCRCMSYLIIPVHSRLNVISDVHSEVLRHSILSYLDVHSEVLMHSCCEARACTHMYTHLESERRGTRMPSLLLHLCAKFVKL